MKKSFIITIFISIILITLSFLAFKPKKESGDEVVFWTLQMSDFSPYINNVINEFEKEHPNIKIKWVDIPFSEGEKRTLASVLSDNPPDLVNLNPDFSATLASKGALWQIPLENTKTFNQSVIHALLQNDRLYSIPWYATSAVTIYNKELLNKSSISLPKTYDEIFENSKIVKQNTGKYLFLPNITENDTTLKILNKYGVSDSSAINSDKSIEILKNFQYLYKNDYIGKETISITLQEVLEKYMSEQVVLLVAGANFLNMIKENAPQTYSKTDVSEQIVGSIGQYDFSLMTFVIPLRSKHKQEALEFALFLTNEKNQLELAKLTNVLATNEKALKNEFYTNYNKDDLMAKARVISAKQLNNLKPVYRTHKNQKEINNIVNNAVQEILLDKFDVKLIMDKVQKDWKIIEE